jgi:nitroreductase
MNEIINNMIERRSIRTYKTEQIAEAELEAILQAGIYAPSAGSRLHFEGTAEHRR